MHRWCTSYFYFNNSWSTNGNMIAGRPWLILNCLMQLLGCSSQSVIPQDSLLVWFFSAMISRPAIVRPRTYATGCLGQGLRFPLPALNPTERCFSLPWAHLLVVIYKAILSIYILWSMDPYRGFCSFRRRKKIKNKNLLAGCRRCMVL